MKCIILGFNSETKRFEISETTLGTPAEKENDADDREE